MDKQFLTKRTKKELIDICENLSWERDNNVQEKEIIIKAFNECIKELEEIRKRFIILTSKKEQDFIEQAKKELGENINETRTRTKVLS